MGSQTFSAAIIFAIIALGTSDSCDPESLAKGKCCDSDLFIFQDLGCPELKKIGACFLFPWVRFKCAETCNRCNLSTGKKGRDSYNELVGTQNEKLRQCCISRGVSPECAAACNFQTTAAGLMAKGLECLDDLKTLVACAAGTRDNRECCEFYGVSESCRDIFCRGNAFPAKLTKGMLPCMAKTREIFACHQALF